MKQSEIKDLMIAGFMEDMGQEGYVTLLQRMKDYRVFNHASLFTRFKNTIKDIRDRNSIDLRIPLPFTNYTIQAGLKLKEIDILYKESDGIAVKVVETIPIGLSLIHI